MDEQFDAVVVGMGPGGEVASSRLLAAGRRVAVVERELIGGECGYWACIPSKTLIRSPEVRAEARQAAGVSVPTVDWPELRAYRDKMIRHLDDSRQVTGYEEQGATVVKGTARLVGRDPWRVAAGDRTLTAGHVIVATGSAAVRPPVDGLDRVPVWTNREATTLREIPSRAVLVGGSAVGVELGQFLARMGCAVTLVQRGPRLVRREEPRVGELVAGHLRADGIDVRTGCQLAAVRRDDAETVVDLDDGTSVRTDVVVLGAGREARTGGLGLAELGIETGGRGELPIDGQGRVTDDGLWAVGDVTGVAMFTHVAQYQGRVVADTILGKDRTADYTGVPRVVFADPEIAAVGLTSAQAQARGLDLATAEVDLPTVLARPWTYQTEPAGTLGLLADRGRGVLVGAWAVAPLAAEWIHQAGLAIRAGIPLTTLLDGVAQFPTFSQGYLNALEALSL
ncbi:MAG: pyridine nucleotide-disulfide oxidoreductase [Micromonosporaceae bacterium]|nr:pyridine nucleotide-disulfide oxidoreductase [Micromonosporaceae bacterium]